MEKYKTHALFELAQKQGIEEMEIYIGETKSFNVRVYDGKVEHFALEENRGLSARGISNGSMGYIYTENLKGIDRENLISGLKENADIMEASEKEEIHFDNETCCSMELKNSAIEKIAEEEKIEFALEMEKKAFSIDERIEAVNYCLFGESSGGRMIVNSKGLDLCEEKNIAFAFLSVVAKAGGAVKTGSAYTVSNEFGDFDAESLAKEAARKALDQLEAKTMASGPQKTLLSNEVSADLLQAFSSAFSAENVQRNLSLLKGRLGQTVGVEDLTITDDPFLQNKAGSRNFDDEGTCTLKKNVIENGILRTFLHNKKTAKKEGLPSTGNAYKGSYKSPVSIAPTNFFISPGTVSISEAMENMGAGVYITDVQGLHAGLNAVSGDFSLSASGFAVRGGKMAEAVHQITVAGNYFDMLTDIEAICSDIKFIMPGSGQVGSPSILIGKLDISGE